MWSSCTEICVCGGGEWFMVMKSTEDEKVTGLMVLTDYRWTSGLLHLFLTCWTKPRFLPTNTLMVWHWVRKYLFLKKKIYVVLPLSCRTATDGFKLAPVAGSHVRHTITLLSQTFCSQYCQEWTGTWKIQRVEPKIEPLIPLQVLHAQADNELTAVTQNDPVERQEPSDQPTASVNLNFKRNLIKGCT